ncbi:hypothetical protein OUZ56_003952 [Daphnia magna]|uniref:Uncharacterized protein n=1 Tax=Daphnia magna TaxID=35525 RepID=A0ABQ9YNB7_9CRUS|nr:hypothetical protein OUZ56_003952 [Daphnia magna]
MTLSTTTPSRGHQLIYGFAWMHGHERNVRSVELIHYVLTHPHDFYSFPPVVKMCRRLLASAHCVSKQFAMKCVIVPSNQWAVDYTTIDGKGERIYIASIVA